MTYRSALRLLPALLLCSLVACGSGDDPARPDGNPQPGADAAGPATITVEIRHGAGATIHAVYQDGTGPWQRAISDGDDRYSFTVQTGRFGYGYTCADAQYQEAIFAFATVGDELPVLGAACGSTSTHHTVTGEVTGLGGHGFRGLVGNSGVLSTTASATEAYEADPTEDADAALVFARFSEPQGARTDRLVIRRGISISGDRVENIDFATEGHPTAPRSVTIAGAGDDGVYVRSTLRVNEKPWTLSLTRDTTQPYTVEIPADADWRAGDRVSIGGTASYADGYRSAARGFGSPTEVPETVALTLPAPLVDPVFTATRSGPGLQFRATARSVPDAAWWAYAYGLVDNPSCADGFCYPFFQVDATAAWVEAAGGVSIATPDPAELGALGAWDDRLDVPAGGLGVEYQMSEFHRVDGTTYTATATGTLAL